MVDRKLIKTPSNLIAGRPKAALLLCFFGDFRCSVCRYLSLFVLFVYIEVGKNRC